MENQNSICYVAKINEIRPIEGADNIELAIVGGWNCITKKGEQKVGDIAIIATTDAVIPFELSEDMGVTNYLRKGGRVKTVKLRGIYSECLIIPFERLVGRTKIVKTWEEGDDLMQALDIFKYEPPVKQIQLASGKKIRYSENPNFKIYYKFPNLKNVVGLFNEENAVQITRKLHGTNARYGIVKRKNTGFFTKLKKFFGNKWAEYEFVVGSHNVEKGSDSQGFYDTNVWYEIADKYEIKQKLWDFVKETGTPEGIGEGFCIYGEIYGAGIQKNYEYSLKDIRFSVFDVTLNGDYVPTGWTEEYTKELDLDHVEVLYDGLWTQEIQDSFVFNNFIDGTKVPHEGIVIKHVSGDRSLVAKVINPDYLIYGEKYNVGDSH
jgi:RNA ligase (TIGR02306 family)